MSLSTGWVALVVCFFFGLHSRRAWRCPWSFRWCLLLADIRRLCRCVYFDCYLLEIICLSFLSCCWQIIRRWTRCYGWLSLVTRNLTWYFVARRNSRAATRIDGLGMCFTRKGGHCFFYIDCNCFFLFLSARKTKLPPPPSRKIYNFKVYAPAENRTRGLSLATTDFTTKPLALPRRKKWNNMYKKPIIYQPSIFKFFDILVFFSWYRAFRATLKNDDW